MGIRLQYPQNKDARILIVDDSETNVAGLKRLLQREGYNMCVGISDSHQAVHQFLSDLPHLLLLDWHMERLSGEEFLTEIHKHIPEEEMPPVLVLTADTALDIKRRALQCGATDFLAKPVDYIEMLLRIRNLLHLGMLHQNARSENARLETKIRQRTVELEQSIVQLKEAQGQIIQQERLHALGAMAGGVAHDFNNVLMVILGFGDLYLKARDEEIRDHPAEVREALEMMICAANDAVEMVRRLGEFYRPQSSDNAGSVEVDLNGIMREAARLCEPKWLTQKRGEGIFIDLRMELGDVPRVFAVPSELRELMTNLIFNAVDAMPQGGRLVIRTRVEEGHAAIEVEDSGTGMTEETRVRCMEPFYTTKGDQGTGLGLAIIHGIVRRHNGSVRIATELNQGTTFTILLPLQERAISPAPEAAALPHVEKPLNVLVVDDNLDVRNVTVRYLQHDGHVVTTADNGCEALEKFQTEPFDLVITDCSMPKMSGDQMAIAIKELNPAMPIILLSGFAPKTQPAVHNVDLLLGKPLSLDSLRHAIDKVVACKASAPA